MYIPEDKVVVVTQHVRNIETLTDQKNGQLTSYLKKDNRQEKPHDFGQKDVQVHPSAKNGPLKVRRTEVLDGQESGTVRGQLPSGNLKSF